MAEMSDYLEDSLVTHIFRTNSWSKPTVLALALLTTAADDDDTGTFSTSTGVEVPNSNAYARVARNPLDANWAGSVDGMTNNVAAITFAQATGSWGTVVALAIVDSATFDSGNMLFHSTVNTSRTIDNGDTAELAATALTITFD